MANTRSILGEQATLDGLVTMTLESLEEDGVTSLPGYSLGDNKGLKSVKFPRMTSVGIYAFEYCTSLTTAEFSGSSAVSFGQNAFIGCSALNALIIRSTTMSTLANVNALTGTKIANGLGAVYVPSDLVATYKANSVWKNFFIASIDDYPLSEFGTIRSGRYQADQCQRC